MPKPSTVRNFERHSTTLHSLTGRQ